MSDYENEPPVSEHPDKPLSNQQAADYLGMTTATLNKWRCSGKGPQFLKVGRLIKYRKVDLDEFLAGCICQSTAEFSGQF